MSGSNVTMQNFKLVYYCMVAQNDYQVYPTLFEKRGTIIMVKRGYCVKKKFVQ